MDFIIDGHSFLNVSLNVTKNMVFNDRTLGNKYWVEDLFNEGEYLLKDQVRIFFRNFCLNYLNSIIYTVSPKVDNVHIVFDCKSWRKEYLIDFFSFEFFSYSSNQIVVSFNLIFQSFDLNLI